MNALVLTKFKHMEVKNVKKPQINPNEVLIEGKYAGVCGTDKDLFSGRPGSADAVPPVVLGHENSGVISQVGSGVKDFKVGDRVTVDPNIYCGKCFYCHIGKKELCDHLSAIGVNRNGGLEQYFTAPATQVYKIPDNVSLKEAAASEPISCAVHGANLLKLAPYQKALVVGDGFMGQLFVQILQAYGVHQVDFAGLINDRLALNKEKFHVKNTFNTKYDKIPADYDVVVEAVGLPVTQEIAVNATRKGAQVLMFGVGQTNQTFKMNTYKVYQKQLTIQGSFINPDAFEDSLALLSSKKLNILPLISDQPSLDEVPKYLDGTVKNVSKAIVKVEG